MKITDRLIKNFICDSMVHVCERAINGSTIRARVNINGEPLTSDQTFFFTGWPNLISMWKPVGNNFDVDACLLKEWLGGVHEFTL